MNIGLLETGRVSETLVEKHGHYPAMFEALYRQADPKICFETFAVVDGVLPERPDQCTAWLVIGSKHGVYDPLPWIAPLKAFLRQARAARVPIIGVCFGHQLMAEAFGGRAEKSERGWGCGVHRYSLAHRPTWMAGAPEALAWHAMHQDQVTAIPAEATVLAKSDFCPYAMLAYGDPEHPDAVSIQPHPEFESPYARDLIVRRSGTAIPEERARAALAGFGAAVDNQAFAQWTLAYLHDAIARREAP